MKNPNQFQSRVADWLRNGKGNAVVNAVAGSGKTTLLVWLASMLTEAGIFIAFNRVIADELGKRLRGSNMTAKTIHSVGFGALRARIKNPIVDDKKYRNICKEVAALRVPDLEKEEANEWINSLYKLSDLVRSTLTDPTNEDAVMDIVRRFDLPVNGYPAYVAEVVARGERMAQDAGRIDYTDMIFLPIRWKLSFPTFGFVFVDECQDLNACQLAVAMRLRAPGGRMLFVGDRRQAIYGFAGADARAFDAIIERTNAVELPLSVCYRCPSLHLELARTVGVDFIGSAIVPQIEAAPNAKPGTLSKLAISQLETWAQAGDLILARRTAPLISRCLSLIRAGKSATVRGRDIGASLVATLKKIAERVGETVPAVTAGIDVWREEQFAVLLAKDADESAFESVRDRADCMLACIEGITPKTLEDLYEGITRLFDVKDGNAVVFSTAHRAKGLEAERVGIIEPSKLPLVWEKQQRWQLEQELNLQYVAYTRSKDTLAIFE